MIEFCRALLFSNFLEVFITFTHSFVAIELLTLCKNTETILLVEIALTILVK